MITFEHLRQAVQLRDFDSVQAQMRMSPTPRGMMLRRNTPPRKAGVLVLIYAGEQDLNIVLTRRTQHLRGHSGQISFPGGKHDPDDADFIVTALRETCEELGLCDETSIQIIGQLQKIYIPPSHFDVYPSVAITPCKPVFSPREAEVAEVLILPVQRLLSTEIRKHEVRTIQGYRVQVPYYDVSGHKVWGATAIMLSELEHRLRTVLPHTILTAIT